MKPTLAEELLEDGGWEGQPIFNGATIVCPPHQWIPHENVGITN